MASATLVEAAMAATQEAKDEPVPSALSHMVRKASIDAGRPRTRGGGRVLLDLAGVEGQGHGGHEEAGLAVEVVVDQGGSTPASRATARRLVPS